MSNESAPPHYGWLPPQVFEVGDIVTFTQNFEAGPMFRLITAVRGEKDQRSYTWEYLDRGIDHGIQHRDDEDYDSELSSDPHLWYWRRILRHAERPTEAG